MSRRAWRWLRLAGAAAVLAAVVWRVGGAPFLDGLRDVDAAAIGAALALTAVSIVCSAWRWRVISHGLGADLTLGSAVTSYYRSVFLNLTLPGGIIGDVHRGIAHGRDGHNVSRGLRSVIWERASGQIVQAVLTVLLLLILPSPVRPAMPFVAVALVACVMVAVFAARRVGDEVVTGWRRPLTVAARDIRDGVIAPGAWMGVTVTSVIVVACQALMFLVAARTAGVSAPYSELVPLAMLVLAAMVLPNIAGWGPREGVAAWAFAAAGLGASQGVGTAVVYGVMAFAGALPGAGVLIAGWLRHAPVPVAASTVRTAPVTTLPGRGTDG